MNRPAGKSIADFLGGKLRRAEVEDRLALEPGEAHPELGAHEGTLTSAIGSAHFYASGMIIGQTTVRYEELSRVELVPEGVRVLTAGQALTIHSSPAGALVVHAALRWIGHTILRRAIAD